MSSSSTLTHSFGSSSIGDSDDNPSARIESLLHEKSEMANTINKQSEIILDLEHKLREAERKEINAVKDKMAAIKELDQHKKFMATDYKSVDQLKAQLQEEHTTNASLIIFNR